MERSSDVYFILKVVVVVYVRMFLESVYTIFAYIQINEQIFISRWKEKEACVRTDDRRD